MEIDVVEDLLFSHHYMEVLDIEHSADRINDMSPGL
jgi:hypothetical protein